MSQDSKQTDSSPIRINQKQTKMLMVRCHPCGGNAPLTIHHGGEATCGSLSATLPSQPEQELSRLRQE